MHAQLTFKLLHNLDLPSEHCYKSERDSSSCLRSILHIVQLPQCILGLAHLYFVPHLMDVFVHISDRFLPDKAIDLIDEAGARVRLRHAQV